MSRAFDEQVRGDFQKARFKAFLNRAWDALSGQRTTLLSCDEIKESKASKRKMKDTEKK